MEKENYFEKIHRYLADEMNETERTVFENEMKKNETLQNDVRFEKKLLAGIELAKDEELHRNIAEAHSRLKQKGFFENNRLRPLNPNNNKYFIMKRAIAIAASIIVIAGIAWWGFFRHEKETPVDPDKAFSQYYKPEAGRIKDIIQDLELKAPGFATPDSLLEALRIYSEGNYDQAVSSLDTFLVNHPENDTAKFYLAMSHLNMERYARAIEILQPLTEHEDFVLQDDAKWYLGLSYLKVENGIGQAIEIFASLAEDPGYKDRQSAEGLLRLLKKKE